jgi:hypothetical protein
MLYRKITLLEVVEVRKNGDYLVHNAGDDSDMWIISKETFERTYEPATNSLPGSGLDT